MSLVKVNSLGYLPATAPMHLTLNQAPPKAVVTMRIKLVEKIAYSLSQIARAPMMRLTTAMDTYRMVDEPVFSTL